MQEQLTQAFDAWVTLGFTPRESRFGGIPDTFAPKTGKRGEGGHGTLVRVCFPERKGNRKEDANRRRVTTAAAEPEITECVIYFLVPDPTSWCE